MAQDPKSFGSLMQDAYLAALGVVPSGPTDSAAYSQVRLTWPTNGQPDWAVNEDVVFVQAVLDNPDIARWRDFADEDNADGMHVDVTTTYTRTWSVSFIAYGPNSFDRLRAFVSYLLSDRSGLVLEPADLYVITDVYPPTRVPEMFGSQWFERSDLTVKFNELVQEQSQVNAVVSVDVTTETQAGDADLQIITGA